MIYKIERLQLSSKVISDDCWQEKNSKDFKKRLRNCPFNLLVISRTNHLEERGNHMIKASSNSNFDVKSAPIQFYGNSYNSQSDRWMERNVYVESLDMLSYLGLKFQVNREGIQIQVNRGCTYFVIYFLLTCGLPIWLGFFS
jgi:hypothetical protein